MSFSEPTRTAARRTRSAILAVLLVVSATLIGALVAFQSLAPSSPSFASLPIDAPRGDHQHAPRGTGGEVADAVTVFDEGVPAVANLDPDLVGALREAAADAEDDGVEFFVNSGWRSAEYQDQLLREAITRYGSEDEAARWVAAPETSAHVSGDAVDLGPFDATAWLSEHGAEFGLCQIYDNEPWHYELRPDANDRGCPASYADPTQDPRMQQ